MARQTIADYLTNALAAAGVERIWGVTGDSLNGLSDSLRRLGKIEWANTDRCTTTDRCDVKKSQESKISPRSKCLYVEYLIRFCIAVYLK